MGQGVRVNGIIRWMEFIKSGEDGKYKMAGVSNHIEGCGKYKICGIFNTGWWNTQDGEMVYLIFNRGELSTQDGGMVYLIKKGEVRESARH